MIINKIVIHELIKEQHNDIQPSNIRPVVLDKTKNVIIKLVQGITSLYGSRNNNAHYGTFRTDEGRGNFPDNFENYAEISSPDNTQFLSITRVAMTALYSKAESQTASSGGYILFVDYSIEQSGRFFLTAMIKQKEGIKLKDNLEPEELIQLDLNRLYQAARISFGKLSAYLAADENARMDLSYLSFVSPKSGQSASGYFVKALGCAPGAASGRATKTLIKEGTSFFRQNDALKPHVQTFRNALIEYLADKQKSQTSAKLSEIETLARPYMPADQPNLADQLANDFISHLNSEEHAVPVEFPVHKTTLTRYTHIKYKADNYELKFERGALGNDDTAEIYYDVESNRIIIKDIPLETVNIIKTELRTRNSTLTQNVT